VVDTHARTPLTAQVLDGAAATLVAVAAGADADRVARLRDAGVDVVELPAGNDGIDLQALLVELGKRQVLQVLVEGGATVAGSFLRARLVDRVVGYHAPALLGAGLPVLPDIGVATIDDTLRLVLRDVTRVGNDVRVTAAVPTEGP
jgi:diaminohydroxyphosphoribosylaminopyrimidine deaminase/5-amino-6-(5-phosphoribosylamino)uracil reductase